MVSCPPCSVKRKMNMDKEVEQKMMDYIDALEKANEQLIFALKKCVELLALVRPPEAGQKGWQNILDDIEEIIRVGERIVEGKPLH